MDAKLLSVALVGNIANNFYREALALRSSGIRANVFSFDHKSNTSEPESDPAFSEAHREWVFRIPSLQWREVIALLMKDKVLSDEMQESLTFIASHDLVVVSGPETVLIPAIAAKCIWRPTGSDLTVFPALGFNEKIRIGRAQKTPKGLLRHTWERIVYRRAISSAALICVSPSLPPFRAALDRLGVQSEKLRATLPLVIDAEAFRPTSADKAQGRERWPELAGLFVVFWPARIMVTKPYSHGVEVRTGQWKRSEAGLEGFALFLARLGTEERSGVMLAIPDRTQSDDLDILRGLIADLGLNENVIFVAGDSRQGLTRQEMLMVLANSSATFNDFGPGWYGSAALEAVAAGVPVITFAPDEHYPDLAPLPFMNAKEPAEIADQLHRLWSSRAEIERIRESGFRWLEKCHSGEAYLRILDTCSAELLS